MPSALTKTLFASGARIATPTAVIMATQGRNACILVIDETAHVAGASVVFTLEGFDRASGKWYTILASAAIVGEGTTRLRVGVGLTAAANLVANDFLPDLIRLSPVHGTADSTTYSVGICLIDL